MLPNIAPMPTRPMARAAAGTDAPSSRALSGITGRTAPSASPNSSTGLQTAATCLGEKAPPVSRAHGVPPGPGGRRPSGPGSAASEYGDDRGTRHLRPASDRHDARQEPYAA